MKTIRYLILLTFLTSSYALAENGVSRVDLRTDSGWKPYRIHVLRVTPAGASVWGGWWTSEWFGDVDGDGDLDRVRCAEQGVRLALQGATIRATKWQCNFPPDNQADGTCGSVNGAWDLDGDDEAEIVVVSTRSDRRVWWIRGLDQQTGEIKYEHELTGGAEVRQDGQWDGCYRVVGVESVPTPGGTRRAFIVMAIAGFDLQPRGALALDVETGEVLWRYLTASPPFVLDLELVDFVGDGSRDIVFVGPAVDNLGGREIGGVSDDFAWLHVVAMDGQLRWRRTLGAAPAGARFTVGDLNGDGHPEIFLMAPRPRDEMTEITILDAQGIEIAHSTMEGAGQGLRVVTDARGRILLYISFSNEVRRYDWDGNRFDLEAVAVAGRGPNVVAVADLVGDDDLEVVVGTVGQKSWVLDENLRPLSEALVADFPLRAAGASLETDSTGRHLVRCLGGNKTRGAEIEVVAVPRPVPWGSIGAALGLIGGVGGGVVFARRRRKPTPSTTTAHELRLQLLGRLQLSGHGAIGALSSLRRLNWHLDSLAQGFVGENRVDGVLRDLWMDCRTSGLPGLLAALELAELAGLDSDRLDRLAATLRELEAALGDESFDLESLRGHRDELIRLASEAEAGFSRMRREIETEFQVEPGPIVQRVLAGQPLEGIEVRNSLHDAPACQVDTDEFVFILDNLIENAVRAMEHSSHRVLELGWAELEGHVLLTIADTGCGIAPDEIDLVMQPGHSKRQGGGLGLPRSRELLGKYGGSLIIQKSGLGEGTTMALTLPRSTNIESTSE